MTPPVVDTATAINSRPWPNPFTGSGQIRAAMAIQAKPQPVPSPSVRIRVGGTNTAKGLTVDWNQSLAN